MASRATLIFIALAVVFVLVFASKMLRLFRQSRDVEKTIDYSKMKEWEDEDD